MGHNDVQEDMTVLNPGEELLACNTNTTRLISNARVSGSPGRDGAAARYVSVVKRLFTRC